MTATRISGRPHRLLGWWVTGLRLLVTDLRRRWYLFAAVLAIWVLAVVRLFVHHTPVLPLLFNWTPSIPYHVVWVDYRDRTLARGDFVVQRSVETKNQESGSVTGRPVRHRENQTGSRPRQHRSVLAARRASDDGSREILLSPEPLRRCGARQSASDGTANRTHPPFHAHPPRVGRIRRESSGRDASRDLGRRRRRVFLRTGAQERQGQ